MSKGAEPVAQGVLDILKAGMPAILLKIRNEYQDAVPLPDIKSYYFGERVLTPDFPCIIVDAASGSIDEERFHFQWAHYDHQVTVDVLVQSDNEDVITRQCLRYMRAIWEVLFGNQTDKDGNVVQAVSIRPVSYAHTPLVDHNDALFKGGHWELAIHRYDDLT